LTWFLKSLLTFGAEAPIHDFGFVDDKAVIIGRSETGCGARGAVDVDGLVAPPADEMMMVVSDSGLIQRGPPGRFDPAEDPRGDERVEVVVHGLPGEGAEALAGRRYDKFGVLVLTFVIEDIKDRQPRRG
jgi:hypothetical protein